MAKADVHIALESIDAAGFLDTAPGAGREANIHNIFHEDEISIELYDGTNQCEFEANIAGPGAFAYYTFHVTNSIRIRIKNEAGTAKLIGYSGVITK